jgi:hypothetical protein
MTVKNIPKVDGKYLIDEETMNNLIRFEHHFSEGPDNEISVVLFHEEKLEQDIEEGLNDLSSGNIISEKEMKVFFEDCRKKLSSS